MTGRASFVIRISDIVSVRFCSVRFDLSRQWRGGQSLPDGGEPPFRLSSIMGGDMVPFRFDYLATSTLFSMKHWVSGLIR